MASKKRTLQIEEPDREAFVDFIDWCGISIKIWDDGSLDVTVRAGFDGEVVATLSAQLERSAEESSDDD